MYNDDGDANPDDFVDNYYDEIIRHTSIAHSTKEDVFYFSGNQREVASASTIELSIY
jgi:hypothetical protein